MSDAGFSTELSDRVVEFSSVDAERFVLVPRLAEIAAPLLAGKERDNAIREALRISLARIAKQGKGNDDFYRSHWIYGLHSR